MKNTNEVVDLEDIPSMKVEFLARIIEEICIIPSARHGSFRHSFEAKQVVKDIAAAISPVSEAHIAHIRAQHKRYLYAQRDWPNVSISE